MHFTTAIVALSTLLPLGLAHPHKNAMSNILSGHMAMSAAASPNMHAYLAMVNAELPADIKFEQKSLQNLNTTLPIKATNFTPPVCFDFGSALPPTPSSCNTLIDVLRASTINWVVPAGTCHSQIGRAHV